MKKIIRKIFPKNIKKIIKIIFLMQFKYLFFEEDLLPLSKKITISKNTKVWQFKTEGGVGGWFRCPNHSGGYHGLLRQWWDFHGLGGNILLVSESIETRLVFEAAYPTLHFKCCDYFLDAGSGGIKTDFIWNMYEEPSNAILNHGKFNSIICQATFEHLMDPVAVLKKLADLLSKDGYLYMHTHTPLYPYHACPRDYIRFNHDWFVDVPQIVTTLDLEEMHAEAGHIFACYRKK